MSLWPQLKPVRLLLLDVDGVLTDGRLWYPGQAPEIKSFCVRDGLGLKMLRQAGLTVGIVTGRSAEALQRRCHELGISLIFDNIADKAAVLDEILRLTGTPAAAQVAFMGDDLPDLPLFKRVGVPIAVADAHPLVRAQATLVTTAHGGRGAVREICEALLQAQGLWENALARFN